MELPALSWEEEDIKKDSDVNEGFAQKAPTDSRRQEGLNACSLLCSLTHLSTRFLYARVDLVIAWVAATAEVQTSRTFGRPPSGASIFQISVG